MAEINELMIRLEKFESENRKARAETVSKIKNMEDLK